MQQFALSVQHSRTVSAQKRLPCTACFIGTAPPTARRPSARGASRRGPSHLHRGRSAPSFQPRGWAGVRPGSMRQWPTSTKSSTHTGAASVCQRTPMRSSSNGVLSTESYENKSTNGSNHGATAILPLPNSHLFEIHCGVFQLYPTGNCPYTSVRRVAHSILFFGVGKDTLNRFFS